MPHRSLVILLITFASVAIAQPDAFQKSLELDSEVRLLSTDRLGNFYVLTRSSLWKIGTDGQVMANRTYPDADSVRMLEAWNPLKILLHAGGHRFDLLDSDLQSSPETEALDEALAIHPMLVTSGAYTRLMWILDSDGSVKFIDWTAQKVIMESTPFDAVKVPIHIQQLRNYQNNLFLLDRSHGLYVVGRSGKLVDRLEFDGASHMGSLGEDVYVHLPGRVVFIDLYTKDRYEIPVPADVSTAAVTDERLLLASGKRILLKSFRPKS